VLVGSTWLHKQVRLGEDLLVIDLTMEESEITRLKFKQSPERDGAD